MQGLTLPGPLESAHMAKREVKVRSAGVIPVRRDPDGWRLLALRAWRNWDFPKGLVEEGEDRLEAARREAREEAALDDLVFPWGDVSADTEVYARGKVATYFLGQTERREVVLPVNPELGHPEHHEGRWLTFDQAAELLPARLQPILAWARGVVSG
jgi:8-oxo-dGTP pyrophosphatase MutT (NUDIX family)